MIRVLRIDLRGFVMSREIKFRCWNEHGKCFHTMGELKDALHLFNNKNPSYVVEQFTGLKDVNGTEIYEGDRLKCLGYEGVVVFDVEEPRFAIKPDDCEDTFALIKYEMMNFEIIGNIHEVSE